MRFIRFLLIIGLFCCSLTSFSQYTFKGIVQDSLTQEPLPYISLYFEELNDGCISDLQGHFLFTSPVEKLSLRISAMGYKDFKCQLTSKDTADLKILLQPSVYSLNEVVVHSGKEKYKKDNPAVRFVREMIRHRDDNDPDQLEFWKRDRYEKTTFYINEFDSAKQKSGSIVNLHF